MEEVVVEPDALDVQHVLPQAGQRALGFRVRRPVARADRKTCAVEPQQRRPIDLPARRQRPGIQRHVARRNHVVRQRRGQLRPQGLQCRRLTAAHEEGAQLGLAARAQHDERIGHARILPQRPLNLGRFDPVAAQLELEIAAAEELELPRLEPPPLVAGPVQTFAVPERTRHVALGGEVGRAMVAEAEARAADVDLPAHADRHRFQRGIQDVELRARDRPADPSGFRCVAHVIHRRPDGGLGRTVDVPEVDAAGEERCGEVLRQAFAATPRAESGRRSPAAVDQQPPRGGRRLHHRHAVAIQLRGQPLAVAGRVAIDHQHARAGDERQEHLERRDVERPRRDGGQHVSRPQPRRLAHAGQHVRQGSMRDGHPLGRAGGTGRVDRVRRLVRRNRGMPVEDVTRIERRQRDGRHTRALLS